MLTRRGLLKLIPVVPFGTWLSRVSAMSPLDRIAAAYPANAVETRTRHYRADCQVSFLGVTVFSRTHVGSANIDVREGAAANHARTIGLTFQAGSLPDRARGLNRLGFIEEFVVEQKDGAIESAYFGFMTSSTEKNMEQAHAALGPGGTEEVPYTAVEGAATQTKSQYELYQMTFPSDWNYSRCTEIVGEVRQTLAKKALKPARAESAAKGLPPRTFLYVVREAMRSKQSQIRSAFLYNGTGFRLDVEKAHDSKKGLMRLNGAIVNAKTGSKVPFRLWFEEGGHLPLRFEYRPRPYLNLVFEHQEA